MLAWYGLGQTCIYKREFERACNCFEKVLEANPNNIETLKVGMPLSVDG